MEANIITLDGEVKSVFASKNGKKFAAINLEIPGAGGRGRAWCDCVGFEETYEALGKMSQGDKVQLLAALDSRKTDRGWQLRFVVQKVLGQTSIPTEEETA